MIDHDRLKDAADEMQVELDMHIKDISKGLQNPKAFFFAGNLVDDIMSNFDMKKADKMMAIVQEIILLFPNKNPMAMFAAYYAIHLNGLSMAATENKQITKQQADDALHRSRSSVPIVSSLSFLIASLMVAYAISKEKDDV